MAFTLLSHVVADLTLGKPVLPWLAASACVRDALAALKQLADDVNEISIWDCSAKSPSLDLASSAPSQVAPALCGSKPSQALTSCLEGSVVATGRPLCQVFAHLDCQCIGKVCMQKIICYLASEKSLYNLSNALDAPVTVLLNDSTKCAVQHIDPDASLLEALDLIVAGAQNLVIPITGRATRNGRHFKSNMLQKARSTPTVVHAATLKDHNGQEYCWLTHEDVLRFLLGSIGDFSPLPMMSIEALGLVKTDVRMVSIRQDATVALEMIKEACCDMSAVAVVDSVEGKPGSVELVGDISHATLQMCSETASLALATLSAGDFLLFQQDCKNPPEVLIDMIRMHVHEKLGISNNQHVQDPPLLKVEDAGHLLQKLEMWEESSSEDDESSAESPIGHHDLSRKWHSVLFRSSRKGLTMKSRSGPIFCNPRSSLIAVLLQALAHREHYVWVTDEDDLLLGIVTLLDILTAMFSHINVFT
ncbi:hypothetical protein L7F22_037985 [Adiantum nelumboides]|nr:hypothetical protein [Adiantum nelumboides]